MNQLLNEPIVVPRLVNTQTVDFQDWCSRLASGSTVTAADVAAVMQQMEDKLPEILTLNAKAICSPNGLTIRPKVSGSIKQSELKAKLEARKAAELDPKKAAAIDVNRALTASDLSIKDCSVSIVVDLPKAWSTTFQQKAILKRVSKTTTEVAEDDEQQSGNTGSGSDDNTGGAGSTTNPTNPTDEPGSGGSTGGGGNDDPSGDGME